MVATGNVDVVATLHFRGCPTLACDVEVMVAVLAGVVELPPRMAGMAAWLVMPSDATSGGLCICGMVLYDLPQDCITNLHPVPLVQNTKHMSQEQGYVCQQWVVTMAGYILITVPGE